MSKWRLTVLALLIAAPALFLMGYGSYQLWESGWFFWVVWPLVGGLAAAGILGWHFLKARKPIGIDSAAEPESDELDQQAWALVEQRVKAAEKLSSDKLLDFTHYTATAQEMALELARVYYPGANDPLGSLTIPEILAVIELAAQDLGQTVDKYVPGAHLMTINAWKNTQKATEYSQSAGSIYKYYKAISALFAPAVASPVWSLASLVGSKVAEAAKHSLALSFYIVFLQRMGQHLIDLYSGRLGGGAERRRQWGGQKAKTLPRIPRISKWRLIGLGVLIAAPALLLMGFGSYQIWRNGWSSWVWMPMTAALALGYFLGWRWQKNQKLLRIDFTPEKHWTERDKQAWKLVEERAKAAEQLPSDKLVDINYYAEAAQEMALAVARAYQPAATDPIGSRTLPEILAVIEHAAHDLAERVEKYVPGGHFMTIDDLKNAKIVSDYYQTANIIYWSISALFSPINTVARFLASEFGVSRPMALLQENLVQWFYTLFLKCLGTYLIELNSGRLRVGAERYRQLSRGEGLGVRGEKDQGPSPLTPHASLLPQVTVGLVGQVKAGKSSLVNALLGEQRARTNILPETRDITRYDLQLEGLPTRLSILDTVGYGHSGPREDQLPATQEAARLSDVLLLALHSRTAARQPDLSMLQALRKWFATRPDLKMPPVIAVLTHIDLLAPAMEWQPPYRWQKPTRVKEQQIAEAVGAVREQLGDYLAAVVPVCVAEGRVWGVEEGLLPTLMELLDEARAVALLRCLRAEMDEGKIYKVFEQLLAAGKGMATVLWDAARK